MTLLNEHQSRIEELEGEVEDTKKQLHEAQGVITLLGAQGKSLQQRITCLERFVENHERFG